MSKKLVVKLIATVMAMTMVVGMGMTALAADLPSGDCQCVSPSGETTKQYNDTQHWTICNDCGKLVDTPANHVKTYAEASNKQHTVSCLSECGFSVTEDCTIAYNTLDGTNHRERCTVCNTQYDTSAHDTAGANGHCSKCNYYDHSKDSSSSSSSSSSSTTKAPTAEEKHEEYAKAVEATVTAEVAAPVTTFTSAAAVNAIPAEAKTTGAAYNLSSVTTTQGFVAAVNKIAKDTPAKAMSVYSSKPIAMNAASIEAVTNSGKALEYTFSYQGHIYKITIPAGAKINMNGQRFAGPLYIGAVLGTTQVIK